MLQGLIAPNEPKKIRELLSDLIEFPGLGYDIRLYTNLGTAGIERKRVPNDLISSIEDGRLGKEILAMREECQVMYILYHGTMRFNKNGILRLGKRTSYRWTDKGLRNVRRTLELVEGCYIEHAKNNIELVEILNEVQDYLNEKNHSSTKGRLPIKSDWIKPVYSERVRYFYDGLPGIAVAGAKKLEERFPSPIQLYSASVEEIMEVPRIGRALASGIYNFLRGIK